MPITAGVIAAPIIAGAIGQQAAAGDRNAANQARANALAQFAGINAPSMDSMTLALENYRNTGQLSPELEQAIALGDTNLAGVSTDPRLQSSQMSALQQLAGIADGSMGAGDQAGFQLARNNAAAEMQAKNSQVLQEMQQRGQAGSGAELLAKLKTAQSGAQMLSNADMEQAKAMQQARLQALQAQGSMASNVRSQNYTQDANLASARDAISKYNAQNSQAVANTNVSAKNNAQAVNLQNSQNIANMNTGVANTQQTANKGLNQTNFNNQLNLAASKAGQYNANANANAAQAANTAGMYASIGQGVGTGIAGYGQSQNNAADRANALEVAKIKAGQ